MRTKIALAIYLVIGLIDLVLGMIYFTSDQFLSYHSQAVGARWQEVDSGTQTLILALMRVAGGGWLALGFLTITLALGTLRTSSTPERVSKPPGRGRGNESPISNQAKRDSWPGTPGNQTALICTLARWVLPTGTVIFWLPCLVATWSVYRKTGAQTPWAPSLALIICAVLALLVDAPWSSRDRGKE